MSKHPAYGVRALAISVVALLLASGCEQQDRRRDDGAPAAAQRVTTGPCSDLANEMTKARRPRPDVASAAGMCRPPGWTSAEYAADIAVVGDVVWLASADCGEASRIWRSADRGRTWWQTGDLHGRMHCSAGSTIELNARDGRHAQAALTNVALIETTTMETNDGGRSWARVGLRCLNSDDPGACG